jgi:hypothetical protein
MRRHKNESLGLGILSAKPYVARFQADRKLFYNKKGSYMQAIDVIVLQRRCLSTRNQNFAGKIEDVG